jgi:hypothetical protein
MQAPGPEATPDEIRKFLTKVDLRTCQNDKGEWVSPLNGEIFSSFWALSGHIGAALRKINPTAVTQDRAGYIKALRRGETPTEAQKEAHRDYMRELRRRRRSSAPA